MCLRAASTLALISWPVKAQNRCSLDAFCDDNEAVYTWSRRWWRPDMPCLCRACISLCRHDGLSMRLGSRDLLSEAADMRDSVHIYKLCVVAHFSLVDGTKNGSNFCSCCPTCCRPASFLNFFPLNGTAYMRRQSQGVVLGAAGRYVPQVAQLQDGRIPQPGPRQMEHQSSSMRTRQSAL